MRAAYIARTKVLHPDRFIRNTHPEEWLLANQLTAELNAAYGILGDPERRRAYDRDREPLRDAPQQHQQQASQDRAAQTTRPAYPPDQAAEIKTGHVRFADLGPKARQMLLARQAGELPNEFRHALEGLWWWYLWMAGAAIATCIAVYAFAADGGRDQDFLIWLPIAFVVLAEGITRVKQRRDSSLRPFVFVTPLYIIRTVGEVVSIWPIWRGTCNTVHHHINGMYSRSEVTVQLGSEMIRFSLLSKSQYSHFEQCVAGNRHKALDALQRRDTAYFAANNDFVDVNVSTAPLRHAVPRKRGFAYAVSFLACGLSAAVAYPIGTQESRSQWSKMPTRSTPSVQTSQRVSAAPSTGLLEDLRKLQADANRAAANSDAGGQRTTPVYVPPTQPLPSNGYSRSYRSPSVAPFEIRTSGSEHHFVKLVDKWSGNTVLYVFVRAGQTAEVLAPLGTYELRYASGTTWYGKAFLFGPQTSYSKSASGFVFSEQYDGYSGHTVTLYKVRNGNLSTNQITAEKF